MSYVYRLYVARARVSRNFFLLIINFCWLLPYYFMAGWTKAKQDRSLKQWTNILLFHFVRSGCCLFLSTGPNTLKCNYFVIFLYDFPYTLLSSVGLVVCHKILTSNILQTCHFRCWIWQKFGAFNSPLLILMKI